MRVLIVDDDAMVREMLATVLSGEGYEVARARHGAEAVERIAAGWQPAVLLLDIVMPVMDGFEVCAWLAAHVPLRERPRVVIMSATHFGAGEAPEADALVAKPFNIDTLIALVRQQCAAHARMALAATA